MTRATGALCVAVLLGFFVPACATYWTESADEEVADVMREKERDFVEFRESELIRPDLLEGEPEEEVDTSDVPETVGLREALAVATSKNRNYQREKESLYISALNLTGVRNRFSVFFTGSLSALLSNRKDQDASKDVEARLGASKILPTGGTVSVDGRSAGRAGGNQETGGYAYDSSVTVSLSQPLLRDAGYESSHEALTQAERDVIYAIRDFELFREDFTIQVLTQFYSLVGLLKAIENAERDLETRVFLKAQSEEKFEVGLATEVDKLRAEREYLRAENDLIVQRETYKLALDRFKILLGLPTDFPLEIRREKPEFRKVRVDVETLVKAAIHNRLDLVTARDRVEDAERDLRIQTRNLLPDLDLTADYDWSSAPEDRYLDQKLDDERWTIGLALEIPFERTAERNAYRRAMIDLDRARRDLSLQEDDVLLEVRDSLRSLRRAEASVKIRRREIEVAQKEAEAARLRFEAGEMDNRNWTDAQNAVLRSQNRLILDLVSYETARIQLLRDVGILFIDEEGMWVEP
jgi:outer membrane protein TolC